MSPTVSNYERVAADIRRKIEAGDLAAGTRLPTKRQLAVEYEVSTQVIDIAMILLRHDGYVHGEQGRGVFVADRSAPKAD